LKSEGKVRESTLLWYKVKALAEKVLEEAKAAWIQRQENRVEESRTSAKSTLNILAQRYYAPPVTEEALAVITNCWVSHSI
jgi:hypothetical protein